MAAIIIIPGVALAGMLLDNPLKDPDRSYIVLIDTLLPPGLRGIILVGLFASLMSSVDSMFNSPATLWSIDVYKRHLNPAAGEAGECLVGGSRFVHALDRSANGFRATVPDGLSDGLASTGLSLIFLHGVPFRKPRLCPFYPKPLLDGTLSDEPKRPQIKEIKERMMQLERRKGNRPVTGSVLPHLQLSDQSPKDVHDHMSYWALVVLPAATPEVREEPTRISVPSTRALWLNENVDANPAGFMPPPGSREFAHLHADGSWHFLVDETLVSEILDKEWGERHPWYDRGVLEVMVYAPRDLEEAETVKAVVLESIRYASKGAVIPFSKQPEKAVERL